MLQKYLFEMTRYYPDEMDAMGNYEYRYFDAYFTEEERIAYLIYHAETCVGFVTLNPYPYVELETDLVIAEFCIFPAYRRHHLEQQAFECIMENHPGKWEIRFSENNTGAKKLWESVTQQYQPAVYPLEDKETVLAFSSI